MTQRFRFMLTTMDCTYKVSWSDGDQEYVGTCGEFRGLSHLAPTEAEALAGVQQLVADVIEDLHESSEYDQWLANQINGTN